MLRAVEKMERTRLSAQDWESAALELIAEQGVGALAIEALARRLSVTKGSFYWHFSSREALLKATLERWESQDTTDVFGQVQAITNPRERLRELFWRSGREAKSNVIYSALLQALDNPLVQPLMERMAKRRIGFMAHAYAQIGLDKHAANHRARLAYAAYVGFLQLILQLGMPRLAQDEFDAYVEHVVTTLIPT